MRRTSVDLALAEVTRFTSSFISQLKRLLVDTTAYTLLAAVAPCLVVAYNASAYAQIGDRYYQEPIVATTYGPSSEYANLTAAPLKPSANLMYFMLPAGDYGLDDGIRVHLAFFAALSAVACRALVLFRPTTFLGKVAPVLVATLSAAFSATMFQGAVDQATRDGFSSDESWTSINKGHLNTVLVLPMVYPVASYFSSSVTSSSRSGCKVYFKFFCYSLLETAVMLMISRAILPVFFNPSTQVDPVEEWVAFKKRKRLVFGISFITSMMSI